MTSTIARIGPKLIAGAAALTLFAWQALPAGAASPDAIDDSGVTPPTTACEQHAVDVLLAPEGQIVAVSTSGCPPDDGVAAALPAESSAAAGDVLDEPDASVATGFPLVAAP